MGAVLINAVELAALAGLRWDARIVYLMELRPRMDLRTGIVGVASTICLRGMVETLYVEPVQGRRHADVQEATIKSVRGALAELERAGLVRRKGGEKLVFLLVLATKSELRPKYDGHDDGHDDGRDIRQSKQQDSDNDGHDDGHDDGHTSELTKIDISFSQSSSRIYTELGAVAPQDDGLNFDDIPVVPQRADQWVVVFQRLGFELHQLKTAKLMTHFVDWVKLGIGVPLVLRAVAHGRSCGNPATPLYFVPIVRQFWQAQVDGDTPSGSAKGSRPAVGGGRGKRGGRDSRIPAEDAVWAASLLN